MAQVRGHSQDMNGGRKFLSALKMMFAKYSLECLHEDDVEPEGK